MHYNFRSYIVLCCFAASLAGCSDGGLRTYEVKGTIHWGGQPVTGAAVYFYPQDSSDFSTPMAYGETDEQGHYRLTTPSGKFGGGAVVGAYNVAVKKGPGVPVDHPSKASVLPIVYAEAHTTPLKAEVIAGKNVFDFTLEGVSAYGDSTMPKPPDDPPPP